MTNDQILKALAQASMETGDPRKTAQLARGRDALLALPPAQQDFYAGMIGSLMDVVRVRGFGVLAAFDVFLELANLLEREVPDV